MKRDFTHENFEDFLKRSSDSLRMKAPDKVWQNLSKELGRRRRRMIIGLSLFLLATLTSGYFIIEKLSGDKGASLVQQPQLTESFSQPTGKAPSKTASSIATPIESPSPSLAALAKTNRQRTAPSTHAAVSHQGGSQPDNELALNEMPGSESLQEESFTPTVVDSYPAIETGSLSEKPFTKAGLEKTDNDPLTIESVLNAYKAKNATKRFETQLYFTPTISYRKLSENKSYLRSLDPASIPASYPGLNSSVKNHVTHKPDLGFEVGLAGKYALNKNVKIRSGVQFNVNRYDVRAFSSSGSVATIALSNGSRIDSLNTYSSYSNIGGYKTNWLQNLSFQVSAPVGVEYLFKGNDKLQFGFATTVQPTYVLGDRAYLITTDYKSYTEVPWLIRRWNVNTSFETFITYEGEKTTWQIGPQVRYQLLSSFASKYPVKENLFDFGLKLGITLNKR